MTVSFWLVCSLTVCIVCSHYEGIRPLCIGTSKVLLLLVLQEGILQSYYTYPAHTAVYSMYRLQYMPTTHLFISPFIKALFLLYLTINAVFHQLQIIFFSDYLAFYFMNHFRLGVICVLLFIGDNSRIAWHDLG